MGGRLTRSSEKILEIELELLREILNAAPLQLSWFQV